MTTRAIDRAAFRRTPELRKEILLEREWLVTNGLGGYASGTLSGACTRRFHGLLVAALPAPLGRVVMLNHLMEEARLPDGTMIRLGGEEQTPGIFEPDACLLIDFRLELGLPIWTYEVGEVTLEKRVVMPHRRNAVAIIYRLLRGKTPLRLRLRPSVHFRRHNGPLAGPLGTPYSVASVGNRHEFRCDPYPPLQLRTHGTNVKFVLDGGSVRSVHYRVEAATGYDSEGWLWSPGYLKADLAPGVALTLAASVEPAEAFSPIPGEAALEMEKTRRRKLLDSALPETRDGLGPELVLASDQFLIVPATRPADAARLEAEGEEAVTVVAGYPWFTDWGRDTMISLEGLTLATGRHREAVGLLATFAHYVKDGLIPNQFPEGESQGIYNTADATLWFFHAVEAVRRATGDRTLLRSLLPTFHGIVESHRRGTRFGIRVDPADGLLSQGEKGTALTWMDAKMGDWVVTPRRGKAVEINALWYNALRLLEGWSRQENDIGRSEDLARRAAQVFESFNRRFWTEAGQHLVDVVDGEGGDDPSFRPNQILAVSLPHAVLDPARWEPVVRSVMARLLTPVGLRSLAPGDTAYHPKYEGDLRQRDGAYHQGTVWAWLIGPLIDSWLRIHPGDQAGARRMLEGFALHLGEGCVGSISEIFDAEVPHVPRGCIAQAWSVAEILRSWIRTAPGGSAKPL